MHMISNSATVSYQARRPFTYLEDAVLTNSERALMGSESDVMRQTRKFSLKEIQIPG